MDTSPSRRPSPRPALVAAAADALLAGPWTAAALLARLAESIDPVGPWGAGLVSAVLAAHPAPPADAPREFAVFLDLALPPDVGVTTWRPVPVPVADPEPDPDPDPDGIEQGGHEGDHGQDGGEDENEDEDDQDEAFPGARPAAFEPVPGPVVVRRLAASTAMGPRRWPVPAVDDIAALAARLALTPGELLWFADTRGFQRRDTRSELRHYRFAWVERPGRVPRLLEAPRPRLRTIHRRILDGLLAPLPVHPATHGVTGRSAITGARVHEGAAVVLTMDLESFFSAVTAGRVHGVLRSAGYPEPVAHLLAGVCTLRTPVDVRRRMPAGPAAAASAAWRLGRRLDVPHLPQGAPTSPALANLVAFTLDRRLADYTAGAGWRYTRYADDLTFSLPGGSTVGARAGTEALRLAGAVTRIVASAGFRVNEAKTRIRGAHQRQVVTGLVVNASAAVPRTDYDRLRALLHRCRTDGPAGQAGDHPRFREHVQGRIASVAASHPGRGERLRVAFDAITWPDGT